MGAPWSGRCVRCRLRHVAHVAWATLACLLTGAFVTAFLAAFFRILAAGLAGAFFSALRAEGVEAALGRADGFDFAADLTAAFLDFATALAMDSNYPKRGED